MDVVAARVRMTRHLFLRWWLSIRAGSPTHTDERWAVSQLLLGEQDLWTQMNAQDRFHSVMVARRFLAVRAGATRAEMAGALLHDVGKIRCDLGTTARVIATLIPPRMIPRFSMFGRLRARFQLYRDHADLGIKLLTNAGSDAVTLEMLRGTGTAARDLARADHI